MQRRLRLTSVRKTASSVLGAARRILLRALATTVARKLQGVATGEQCSVCGLPRGR
jgi:hypothetical protein